MYIYTVIHHLSFCKSFKTFNLVYLSGKLWGSQGHLLHHQKENSNCVLKGICGQVSIDTLDRFLIGIPINTWSLIDTWSTFSQLSTVDQPVDGVSLNRVSPKVSVECWQSWSRVSFKVLIDPRLQVPLGHMIWILFLRMQLMALACFKFPFLQNQDNHCALNDLPQGKWWVLFPRDPQYSTSPWETLRGEKNTCCFPQSHGQSLSAFL